MYISSCRSAFRKAASTSKDASLRSRRTERAYTNRNVAMLLAQQGTDNLLSQDPGNDESSDFFDEISLAQSTDNLIPVWRDQKFPNQNYTIAL